MRNIKQTLTFLIVLTSLASLAACESAPGLDKQFGTYYEYLPASAVAVSDAASIAVREMGLQIISEKPSQSGIKIVTRNSFNTKITITAKSAGAESTRVGVHVFPGENEGLSLSVIQEIKNNL